MLLLFMTFFIRRSEISEQNKSKGKSEKRAEKHKKQRLLKDMKTNKAFESCERATSTHNHPVTTLWKSSGPGLRAPSPSPS